MKTLLGVMVVVVGCSRSESAAPAKQVEAKAAPAVAPAPPAPATPAPPAATCADGKLTMQYASMREQHRATVFCKDDGTAAIQYRVLYQGEEIHKAVVSLALAEWTQIWALADAASWRSATLQCTPAPDDEPGFTSHSFEAYRAGVKREAVYCDGLEVSGAFAPLATAVFAKEPAFD